MPTLQFLRVKVFQKGTFIGGCFAQIQPDSFSLKHAASVCSWLWGCAEHGYWMVESETKLRAVTEVKRMSVDQQKQVTADQTLWPKTKGNHWVNKMCQNQGITSYCKTSVSFKSAWASEFDWLLFHKETKMKCQLCIGAKFCLHSSKQKENAFMTGTTNFQRCGELESVWVCVLVERHDRELETFFWLRKNITS